ncbi:nitrous oxide-stimulated promoter family protein [Hippea alviniae]|uniref:nitrous oxide-stimulated promoter family protein n=1 Tax=Hippea alviniae TaxID=1279027 RepID=UPI0003B4EDCC|nr:nitrous oxide-stimulated promoter family protein [Hippea alviniae]
MKKEKRIKRDEKILRKFIEVYCRENHLKKGVEEYKDGLCKECYDLLQYSLNKLYNCPLDPKPQCKHCKVHCYAPSKRKKIKEVMKYSGIWFIKHGRLDWVFHYFF